MNTTQYLLDLKGELLHPNNWQQIILTREWVQKIPSHPGVYALKENDEVVYVGESGNLKGRMGDLLDSRHHTVRRTIGQKLFNKHSGFIQATSKIKFPEHIELLVNNHICTNLSIAYLKVLLGRKELEELIDEKIVREIRLNKRGKRKAL